jgi:hypothetical protein
MEILLLFWLLLCVAVGMFAKVRRNRSFFGWFLFALVLSPLLGFVFCAICETKTWDRGFKREAMAREKQLAAIHLVSGEVLRGADEYEVGIWPTVGGLLGLVVIMIAAAALLSSLLGS